MCCKNRRGVLLLVVLSMLTLFLLLGAAYIAVARRARMTSKAFANNITATAAAGVAERKFVDDAFFAVVRGISSSSDALVLTQGDDLLGDKYGYQTSRADQSGTTVQENASVRGRLLDLSDVSQSEAFISLTVTGLTANGTDPSPQYAAELNGRVLTFLMPGLTVSTRILQAWGTTPGSAEIIVAAGPPAVGESLTRTRIQAALARDNVRSSNVKDHTNILINGREFAGVLGVDSNESYDAADQHNPLLAQTLYEDVDASGTLDKEDSNGNGTIETGEDGNGNGVLDNEDLDDDGYLDQGSSKAAVYANSSSPEVDNDSDGIRDSHFIDVGLPPIMSSSGSKIFPKAAVLVVDLDGRLNANVHGTDAGMEAAQYESGVAPLTVIYGGGPSDVQFGKIPRGSGVGPAEISIERSLVFQNNQSASSSELGFLKDAAQVKGGRTTLLTSSTGREIPQIGSVYGRYGGTWDDTLNSHGSGANSMLAKPGAKNVNDEISHSLDYWRGQVSTQSPYRALDYFTNPGRYASPSDWKGNLRLWVDPDTGAPAFYKPDWSWNSIATLNELIDDPYEVNLTPTGPRGVPADGDAVDNLFSATELEGVLRYFDSDSLKLSRRFVALCGNNASRNRLLVTTESWDTPAITGTAWQNVIGGPFGAYLSDPANRPFRVFSPETVQGLQFDINRPFHDPNTGVNDAYREPNDTNASNRGVERRQVFARQLFCLLVAIVRYEKYALDINNGVSSPFDLQSDDLDAVTTQQLAQYAINVVDFRDADSIMTRFDYMLPASGAEGFKPDNTAWVPNATVWGCERAELLITETHAWHDRRTDDLSVNNKVVEPTGTKDDDFDQKRRPVGAFFVELMAPQVSQAKNFKFDNSSGTPTRAVGDVAGPVNPAESARAEPVPEEFVDTSGNDRFETTGTIDIGKRTPVGAGSQCPVWRIASVRGDVFEGTAFDDTAGAATMKIRDPAQTGAAEVDRVFYFSEPPSSLTNPSDPKDGKEGGVFWSSQAPSQQPTRTDYIVVGTDGPQFDFKKDPLHSNNPVTGNPDPGFDTATPPALPYTDQVHLRFDSPRNAAQPMQITPATLSEPVHDGSSTSDPYDVIAQALPSGAPYNFSNPPDTRRYVDSYELNSPIDTPLDSFSTHSPLPLSDPFLTSETIGGSRRPLLMFNGTHPNFAVVHLQRLANPLIPYDATSNPYLTVDSMTVDLTVVNTFSGSRSNVYDEPGRTPAGSELSWLQEQNHFRRESVERGGKAADSAAPPSVYDIWNRRVRSDVTDLDFNEGDSATWASQNAYRSPPNDNTFPAGHPRHHSTARRSVLPLSGAGTLQKVPNLELGPHNSTFKTASTNNAKPVLYPGAGNTRFPWLAFHNRPFASAAELSLVPTTSAIELGANHTTAVNTTPAFFHLPQFFDTPRAGSVWESLVREETLFAFVHAPSPFVGMRRSVPTSGTNERMALQTLGWDFFPSQQLSQFREPGRVNINTMTAQNIWRAVQGDVILDASGDGKVSADPDVTSLTGTADRSRDWPDADPVAAGVQPFQDTFSVLQSHVGTDNFSEPYRDVDRNAAFRTQTISRLNNSITVRSNVYAIWVTVGYFEADGTEVKMAPRNRGFYLFDRSIPVAYERGQNHNVRDAILLRRIIQ